MQWRMIHERQPCIVLKEIQMSWLAGGRRPGRLEEERVLKAKNDPKTGDSSQEGQPGWSSTDARQGID
jgi:putative SOS response-associated peptidase YedK